MVGIDYVLAQQEAEERLKAEVSRYFIENADHIIIIPRKKKKNFCEIVKKMLKKKK